MVFWAIFALPNKKGHVFNICNDLVAQLVEHPDFIGRVWVSIVEKRFGSSVGRAIHF